MIDQLAKQLFTDVQQRMQELGNSDTLPASQLKAVLESGLRKLNLVTREEFDAQQAVLLRTREKIDKLEAQLQALMEAERD
ncbi:accessory factor UbiK family protein [Saccharophagus degradans]|uniref:Ubiquinone biosynthesis accessory factor UbiK n=1 Tax=Saccharophagus degradans (strain 2-40 / ATCC 43961 / DSM 17024) TaxID=203122 RepID=Q21P98_SACD2|nr:accessory factor UbiK family protein [Saccharophagus degradans]ABD79481.1 protein of unknown function DUF526 [Saccharophagus degradans 2-40]WGO98374.1 accessory factor UbiK family protein [Saccharophagus degradans]